VGTSRLPAELADILNLETSWGCGFRSKAITHSGRKRSPIPGFPITPPGGLLATA
jgi:hypothetical protein